MKKRITAAIIDYQLGNLFSVAQACQHVGMSPLITGIPEEVASADLVLLPGVGAFGDAMANLRAKGLDQVLIDYAATGKPLVGICLGQQLLMETSHEFGRHQGLGLVTGEVLPFEAPKSTQGVLKVPQVGWNTIWPGSDADDWNSGLMAGIEPGTFMYFVHSFYVQPNEASLWLAISQYGDVKFCAALQQKNVIGFQFHPERSGIQGLKLYQNLAELAAGCQE